MDYSSFCRTFYVSHYIPISYFETGKELSSAGIPAGIPSLRSIINVFEDTNKLPAVYMMRNVGLYGAIRVNATDGVFIFGPVRNNIISERVIRSFMHHQALPNDKRYDVERFLSSLPQYSYNRFIYLLVFLHLVINDEAIAVSEHFSVSDTAMNKEIAARGKPSLYRKALSELEQQEHGTYHFEQMIVEYVRRGNPEQMRRLLLDTVEQRPLTEGLMSDSPLRQAKNVFLATVTMAGKVGAISGGMDIEQTYQLIDSYVQECENLLTTDAVRNLQLNMLIDFTSRVQQARLPKGLSDEMANCIRYIDEHLNDDISVQKVADHIHRSQAYLERKFNLELGNSVGKYITDCRMQEAKIWLANTDKPLSGISRYLHYSSQAYFQNVFKKTYGITPARYRKEQQKTVQQQSGM